MDIPSLLAIQIPPQQAPTERHIIPTYQDPVSGAVEIGIRRQATSTVLVDISQFTGIYSRAAATAFRYSRIPESAFVHALLHSAPELAACMSDPEASLSLWPISVDHAACMASLGRTSVPGQQDGSNQPTQQCQERRETNDPGSDDTDSRPVNLTSPLIIRAPPSVASVPSSDLPDSGRTLRVALDFTLFDGREVRRTGTLLLHTGAGARGFGIAWDDNGAEENATGTTSWAGGAHVGLSFTTEHADDGTPFAFLVWTIEPEIPSSFHDYGGRQKRGAYAISVLWKKGSPMEEARSLSASEEARLVCGSKSRGVNI